MGEWYARVGNRPKELRNELVRENRIWLLNVADRNGLKEKN